MASMRQRNKKPNGSELQGADRVVAILLSMGKPSADRIIKQFEDRELRLLARSAKELPAIDLDRIEKLVETLGQEMTVNEALVGSIEEARELLSGVVNEEDVGEIMGELDGQPPRKIWRQLTEASDEKLAKFIAAEHPQVAAYIVSNLDVERASAVMRKLDAEIQAELSSRLLSLKSISHVAARLVAERLSQELVGEEEAEATTNRHARLGAILNQLDREQVAEILGRLKATKPRDAQQVKRHIFSFEDVLQLTLEDRGALLDQVPAEQLVLALRNSEAELQAAVVAVLSPRTRRLVEAELANKVILPNKAIVDARRAIARAALAMAERGTIKLRPDSDEEEGK